MSLTGLEPGVQAHDPAPIPPHRSGRHFLSFRLRRQGDRRGGRSGRRDRALSARRRGRGMRIHFVIDTHVHADHLSAGRQLAEATGAEYVLGRQGRCRFRSAA